MKVVIGTRHWLGSDWTHVDADRTPLVAEDGSRKPVDVVCDARNVKLPDACADLVYSQECLEHFPHAEYRDVLKEWCRLVKVGGDIKIEVPDFLAACKQVLDTDTLEMDRAIQQIIFGGQANKWDFHYVGLTPRVLTDDLTKLNFGVHTVLRGWEAGYLRVEGTRLK